MLARRALSRTHALLSQHITHEPRSRHPQGAMCEQIHQRHLCVQLTLYPSARCPVELVEAAGLRNRSRVTQGSWTTPRELRHGTESPRRAGRPHGPSEPIASRWYSWSNPRAFELEPESPRRGGRHHGPSDLGGGEPGQLVDPAGPRAQARA